MQPLEVLKGGLLPISMILADSHLVRVTIDLTQLGLAPFNEVTPGTCGLRPGAEGQSIAVRSQGGIQDYELSAYGLYGYVT